MGDFLKMRLLYYVICKCNDYTVLNMPMERKHAKKGPFRYGESIDEDELFKETTPKLITQ